MKKALVLVLALIMLSACSKSEQQLIKENFYQAYSSYNVIENGVYVVGKDGKFGIINSETGDVYCDFYYDKMTVIDKEKILAAKNGEYFIVSPKGGILNELGTYGNVRLYYNEEQPRFLTYNDGYYTLLDENGELIADYGEFDHLELNTKTYDRFVIQRGTLYTVINEKGNQVANLGRYDEVVPEFENDAYIVTKNGKKGVINHRGVTVISQKYDNIWKMQKNSSYVVNSGDKFGVADENGKLIVPVGFDGIEGYENVLIAVKDGLYGLFDMNGAELAPCEYSKPYEVEEEESSFKCLLKKGEQVFEALVNEEGLTLTEL